MPSAPFHGTFKPMAPSNAQSKSTEDNQAFEGVYTYVHLDVPDAATIRKLQSFDGAGVLSEGGLGQGLGFHGGACVSGGGVDGA